MRERDVQAKVVGYARGRHVVARKLDFGEGWPDYMFLYDGRVLFMEFKGAGGRLRPLQEYMHAVLRKTGFTVMLVERAEVGQAIIDNFIGALTGNNVVDYSDIIKQVVKNHQ